LAERRTVRSCYGLEVSCSGPTLLVLGHVTRDVFGSETRLGGAASFAARAGLLLGIETALVTVAPPAAPELDVLRAAPRLALELRASAQITTFALEYSTEERTLSLLERARPLVAGDVPSAWRRPEVVFMGTVAGECDEALVDAFPDAFVIGCLQGWLRAPELGPVRARELPRCCALPRSLRALTLSRSDHPRAEVIARWLAARGVVTALTDGRHGATVFTGSERIEVPAAPARELEPTGAGDVFSLVFGLSLWQGYTAERAAARAALAAARVVEGPGLGTLPDAVASLSPRR
jgi:sugar/nucleoside kinase (ribokinase family)